MEDTAVTMGGTMDIITEGTMDITDGIITDIMLGTTDGIMDGDITMVGVEATGVGVIGALATIAFVSGHPTAISALDDIINQIRELS
jgi:hypothetical protein